ncbi:hypothetical protein [Haloferula sp.]|uniref:hypothetical protein n=1 Tax=Haloferula sp. TaxID=2497595 RepID=UPI00329F7B36
MKTTIASTAGLVATIATAAAHPGHSHSNLSTSEFAWHHLLTGGFVGVATISVAWFGYQAFRKRKEVATDRIKKH